jgi:hypothetical protein
MEDTGYNYDGDAITDAIDEAAALEQERPDQQAANTLNSVLMYLIWMVPGFKGVAQKKAGRIVRGALKQISPWSRKRAWDYSNKWQGCSKLALDANREDRQPAGK